jgi:hypothetical protein
LFQHRMLKLAESADVVDLAFARFQFFLDNFAFVPAVFDWLPLKQLAFCKS